MFITAMIVPAILAVVMLMAKLAGYEDAARGSVADGEKAAAQVSQPSGTATPETETPAGAPYVTVLPPTVTPPSGRRREHAEAEDRRDGAGREHRGDAVRDDAAAPTPSPSPGPYGTAEAASKDHRNAGRQDVAPSRPDPKNSENPENAGKTATVENGNGGETTGSRENTGDGTPVNGGQENDAGVAAAMAVDGTAGDAQSATSVQAGRDAVLDPTRVPEPLGPVRVYGGLIRIPQPEPTPQAPPAVVRRTPKPPAPTAPKEPSEPATVETPLTCSPEWRDTWLWELCREHTLALETSPRTGETFPRQGAVRQGKALERDVTGR